MTEYRGMMEGLGGPVKMDRYSIGGIDPALDDCCRREVEGNRRQNALDATLRRHDVVAMTERRRRLDRNLIRTKDFEGCRCSYHPTNDGCGDYPALIEYKKQKQEQHQEGEEEEGGYDSTKKYRQLYFKNVENIQWDNIFLNPDESKNDNSNDDDKNNKNKNKNNNNNKDDDSDSGDEFDYLLDEDLPGDDLRAMEEQRRGELEYELLTRQVAMQHGYGTHRQLHPLRAFKIVGLTSNNINNNRNGNNRNHHYQQQQQQQQQRRQLPSAVVLHLFDPESLASASLDYFIESELAPRYGGTMFVNTHGWSVMSVNAILFSNTNSTIPSLSKLRNLIRSEQDLPALIAIRDGTAVNACPNLHEFLLFSSSSSTARRNQGHNQTDTIHDVEVDTYAVEHWLDQCGVLRTQPPALESLCNIRPEEEALMDYLGTTHENTTTNNNNEDDEYDTTKFHKCGVEGCNKTFYHEHVGIQTSEQSGLVIKEETILGTNETVTTT